MAPLDTLSLDCLPSLHRQRLFSDLYVWMSLPPPASRLPPASSCASPPTYTLASSALALGRPVRKAFLPP